MRYIYEPGDPCRVIGCPLPPVAQGYCTAHYIRMRRHGSPNDRWPDSCTVDGCVGPVVARGLCNAHYIRWYRRQGGAA